MILDVCKYYYTLCHKPMSSLDVILNVQNVKFCPGPCKCKTNEPEPIEVNNEKRHFFKPYSGGRYVYFIYPMLNGGDLILENVRMCSGCNSRYHDMSGDTDTEEEMMAMSDIDAKAIIAKLKNAV